MGYVMAGMPGVVHGGYGEGCGATFGVVVAALKLRRTHRLQEHDPAGVDAFEDIDRPFDGSCGVMELGEGLFIVAGDGGPVFGEGFTEAMKGRHV